MDLREEPSVFGVGRSAATGAHIAAVSEGMAVANLLMVNVSARWCSFCAHSCTWARACTLLRTRAGLEYYFYLQSTVFPLIICPHLQEACLQRFLRCDLKTFLIYSLPAAGYLAQPYAARVLCFSAPLPLWAVAAGARSNVFVDFFSCGDLFERMFS